MNRMFGVWGGLRFRVLLSCLQIGSLIQVPPPVFSVSLWCHASYLQEAWACKVPIRISERVLGALGLGGAGGGRGGGAGVAAATAPNYDPVWGPHSQRCSLKSLRELESQLKSWKLV